MTDKIFEEIRAERQRQDEKFGEQNHPMLGLPFTQKYMQKLLESSAEKFEEHNAESQYKSWYSILEEEICEAFAETKPEKQRKEMIQVAAVAVAIIEYLDRRMVQ